MNYGMRFVTLYRRQRSNHPHGKEMQKSKMAAWGGLTNKPHRKLDKNMNMFLVGLEVGKEKIQRKRDVAGS